jgi:hypothetical protein
VFGDGFLLVLVFVSPKFHAQLYGLNTAFSDVVFVNATERGMSPTDGVNVNEATGTIPEETVMIFVLISESLPPTFVAVRVMVYVPGVEYMCVGFSDVLVLVSPKFHKYVIGPTPVVLFVKLIVVMEA